MIINLKLTGQSDNKAALSEVSEQASILFEIENESVLDDIKDFLADMSTHMADDRYDDIVYHQGYTMGAVLDILDTEFNLTPVLRSDNIDKTVSMTFKF